MPATPAPSAALEAATPHCRAEPAAPTPGASVARTFLTLASGELVARVTAFAATVYAARALGPAAFGLVGFAAALVLYLTRITDAGVESFGLGVREIAEDRRRIESLAPGLLLARFAIALCLVSSLAVISLFLPKPFGLVLTLSGLILLPVGAGARWVLLGLEDARGIAWIRVVGEVLTALLIIALVHTPGDVARVPLAQFVGGSLAAGLFLRSAHRAGLPMRLAIERERVTRLLRRSFPLLVTALLGLVIYNADLLMLGLLRGTESVGQYAAAYALISLLLNLSGLYAQSLLPSLSRTRGASVERSALYHLAATQAYAAGLPIAMAGSLLAPEIIDFVFGPGYGRSGAALALLLWSIPLALVREVATAVLVVGDRQAAILRLTAWTTAAGILLNLALIPPLGLRGAALATVATEGLRLVSTVIQVRGAGCARLPGVRFWRPSVASLAMVGVLLVLDTPTLWLALPAGVGAYAVALGLVGGITRERHRLVPRLRL